MESSNNGGEMGGWNPANSQPAFPAYNSRPTRPRRGSVRELQEFILPHNPEAPVGPRGFGQSHMGGGRISVLGAAPDLRVLEQFSMVIRQANVSNNAGAQTNINYNGQWSSTTNTAAGGSRALQALLGNIAQQHGGPRPLVAGTVHSIAGHPTVNGSVLHSGNDIRTIRPSSIGPRPHGRGTAAHSSIQPPRSGRHTPMNQAVSSIQGPRSIRYPPTNHATPHAHGTRSNPSPSTTRPSVCAFQVHAPVDGRAAAFIAHRTAPLTTGTEVANSECPICLEPADGHPQGCLRIRRVRGCNHMIGLNCLQAMLTDQPETKKTCPLCRATWMRGTCSTQGEDHGPAIHAPRSTRGGGRGLRRVGGMVAGFR